MGHSLRVGSAEIWSLTDTFAEEPLARFFPRVRPEQWQPFLATWPDAFRDMTSWHCHYGCFLIRCEGRGILVDTGLGPDPPLHHGGTLPDDLELKGLDRDEVDTVFLTHAHLDHIGWNLDPDSGLPFFPRARYVISRIDWERMGEYEATAVGFGLRRYLDVTMHPLDKLGVLNLLDGETALGDFATAIPTPGHTPGHMSVLVSANGEKALITGDAFIHPAQVTEPDWSALVDRDWETAARTRRALLDRMDAEGIVLAGHHFPPPGFGSVVRVEGKRYWRKVED